MGARYGLTLRRLWCDEEATTTLEYALTLALVSLTAFVSYRALGYTTAGSVGESGQRLELGTVEHARSVGGAQTGAGTANGPAG